MTSVKAVFDNNGAEVGVGDLVRVLEIPRDIVFFEEESREHVNSMLGEVFEVEEIDAWGCAEVTKWWGPR